MTKRSQDASRQGAALNELIELARQLIILFFPLYRCVGNKKGAKENGKIEIGKVSQFALLSFLHVSALTNDLLVQHTLSIHRSSAKGIHSHHTALPFLYIEDESCQRRRLNSFIIPSPFSSISLLGHNNENTSSTQNSCHLFNRSNFDRKLIASPPRHYYRSVAKDLINKRTKRSWKIVINQWLGSFARLCNL